MGYSSSAATLLILLAGLITGSVLVPAVLHGADKMIEAREEQQQDALARANGEFEIQSAVYNKSTDTLTVKLENTGTRSFAIEYTDLLTDGIYQSDPSTSINGNGARTIWAPGEILRMETTHANAPSRVQVTTTHGLSETAPVEVVN